MLSLLPILVKFAPPGSGQTMLARRSSRPWLSEVVAGGEAGVGSGSGVGPVTGQITRDKATDLHVLRTTSGGVNP